ncbi:ATP synthase F1 subunit delta [bacterium]|nr:ATP synthase F1 subunit delta [bacterium]
MIQNRQIAKRYAKAFLHEKLDKNAFDAMTEELKVFVDFLKSDETAREFFTSPLIPKESKLGIIREMGAKLGFNGYTVSLLDMLIRKNRIKLLETIYEELREISDHVHNRIRVAVTTAFEPSVGELDDMAKKISSFFGRKALVERQVDPSIIGGFTLEGDGKFIDISVIGQIRKALSNV